MSDAGQEGEHEVELLLNRRVVRGVTRHLVHWRGHTSADDEWLRLEELAHCPQSVLEYDAAAPRRRAVNMAGFDAAPAPTPARPLPCPRRHHLWRPPGFGSRLRPSSRS